MADPLRRLRLPLPAAGLGVAMNDSVVAIVGAFFLIGITVGIIAVVALAALRARRSRRPDEPDWPDSGPDDQPRWPGDVDNDFSASSGR